MVIMSGAASDRESPLGGGPALPAGVGPVLRAVRAREIDIRIDGSQVVIDIDGRPWRRRWVWLPASSPQPLLGSRLDAYPADVVLLADSIPPALAAEARERGLWYADAAGRVYLRGDGLFVDVARAPSPRRPRSETGDRPRATANLFSPARAQVVFALLAWPDLLTRPVRTLSHISGASAGHTQEVLATLEVDGYLTSGRLHLLRSGELLDRWAAAFGRGLGRKYQIAAFAGGPDVGAWADAPYGVYVSGEAATDDLYGPGLVLYVPDLDPQRIRASRWHTARPVGGAHNPIIIRRRFWRDPDGERAGAVPPTGVRIAPWPLVYADLVASEDPRAREAASHLARRHELHEG